MGDASGNWRSGVAAAAVDHVKRSAGAARPWLERLARVGFVSQAVVYLVIGSLAMRVARGAGRANADSSGALTALATQQFGAAALLIVAIGSFGSAAWHLVAAITNAGREGKGAWGIISRVGRGVSAVMYVLLGIAAIRTLARRGAPVHARGDAVRNAASSVMHLPAGRALMGIIGAIVIAVACYELYAAYHAKVVDRLDLSTLSPRARAVVTHCGRAGTVAHAVVLALVGWFALHAALTDDARRAAGPAAAVRSIATLEGSRALVVVAIGLIAHGLFQLAQAKYRRVELP